MKLKLTKKQVDLVMNKPEVYGNETKSKTMQKLVALEIYRDSGDQYPLFTLTTRGQQVRNALFELEDLGMMSKKGE